MKNKANWKKNFNPKKLQDRNGKPITIGSPPGTFRVTIAAPEDPNVVLYDLSFPLGTPADQVRRKIQRIMRRQQT